MFQSVTVTAMNLGYETQ